MLRPRSGLAAPAYGLSGVPPGLVLSEGSLLFAAVSLCVPRVQSVSRCARLVVCVPRLHMNLMPDSACAHATAWGDHAGGFMTPRSSPQVASEIQEIWGPIHSHRIPGWHIEGSDPLCLTHGRVAFPWRGDACQGLEAVGQSLPWTGHC